jgi:hypothetical protein
MNYIVPWIRRLVAGLSRRRPGFDPSPVRVKFVVGKVALGKVCFPSTSVFPSQYYSTNVPYPFSSTCCSYQKDKRAEPGNLPNRIALTEIGEYSIEKYFHFYKLVLVYET